ncbi:HIT family protein [Microbacterium sp. SLBN-146]|uniref:HIT family protein n=1 Tax=Microbacterium sp. SLBN-146 TaxID=2768457 RepID=UPI0037CA70B9
MGLYSDARFPGRCIVSLNEHAEHLDDLPKDTVSSFMINVAMASKALRIATDAPRINVAILGNQEGHVHAHLIPRYPDSEPLPNKAPWEDPRPRGALDEGDERRLVNLIARALTQVKARSKDEAGASRMPRRSGSRALPLLSSGAESLV